MKKCYIFIAFELLILSIILLLTFFPTYNIFGYVHTIPSKHDPNLFITIVPNNIFNVLNDRFYSTFLKFIYILIFSLQIINVLYFLILIFIIYSYRDKHSIIRKLVVFGIFLNLSLEVLLLIAFYDEIILLFISFICLIFTFISFVIICIKKWRTSHA